MPSLITRAAPCILNKEEKTERSQPAEIPSIKFNKFGLRMRFHIRMCELAEPQPSSKRFINCSEMSVVIETSAPVPRMKGLISGSFSAFKTVSSPALCVRCDGRNPEQMAGEVASQAAGHEYDCHHGRKVAMAIGNPESNYCASSPGGHLRPFDRLEFG